MEPADNEPMVYEFMKIRFFLYLGVALLAGLLGMFAHAFNDQPYALMAEFAGLLTMFMMGAKSYSLQNRGIVRSFYERVFGEFPYPPLKEWGDELEQQDRLPTGARERFEPTLITDGGDD